MFMDLFWKVRPTRRFITRNLAHASTHPKTPRDRQASVGCLVKAEQSLCLLYLGEDHGDWHPVFVGLKSQQGVETIKREWNMFPLWLYIPNQVVAEVLKVRNDVHEAPNNSRIIDVRGPIILALIQNMLLIKRGLESTVHSMNNTQNIILWAFYPRHKYKLHPELAS